MTRFRTLLLLFAICLPACEEPHPDVGVGFGIPAPARETRSDYRIERPQYTVSYNPATRTPNWVSWRLRKQDIGNAERGPFEPDPLLPSQFPHVTSHVYNGSGFDRGHMCPAKDRSASQADCDSTFFMTNVIPQSPACNQHAWERLESYCRSLALKGQELQITCGPHGVGGTGKNGYKQEIGKGSLKVTVPSHVWKVILVLPYEGARPEAHSRVIAVIMPNDETVDHDWMHYRVTAAAVEQLTGHSFFGGLPEAVAAALRSYADQTTVPGPRKAL